jgi:hypothetical protein
MYVAVLEETVVANSLAIFTPALDFLNEDLDGEFDAFRLASPRAPQYKIGNPTKRCLCCAADDRANNRSCERRRSEANEAAADCASGFGEIVASRGFRLLFHVHRSNVAGLPDGLADPDGDVDPVAVGERIVDGHRPEHREDAFGGRWRLAFPRRAPSIPRRVER